MRYIVNAVIVMLFGVTLWSLGSHIFGESARMSFYGGEAGAQAGLYAQAGSIPLGKVEVHNYQRMGFTKGFLRFSPDNRYLAAGTENGDILLLSVNGNVLWRKNIGLGKIAALEFTADSRRLLVGEISQQGGLLCFEVQGGREVWRQSSVAELDVDIKGKTYPGIVSIRATDKGVTYAIGLRYIRHADGGNEYRGRLYKYDENGRRLAMFPEKDNIDAWINFMSADKNAERVVFGTANWNEGATWNYDDTMYCLDGDLRKVLWSVLLPPVPPYKNPTMRNGPEITPDGNYVAGVVSDGRSFLYDAHTGRELWLRSVSRPQQIAGVYINAVGLYVQTAGSYFLFSTGNTYNRANWQLPTPVEHPSSNSLFVFGREGKLVSRSQLGGMIEQISANESHVAVAVGRNVRSKDQAVHGLYVLSLPDARLIGRLSTAGPCVSAAVSADGMYAAAIEAPLKLDDGRITGEYRLWLMQSRAIKN